MPGMTYNYPAIQRGGANTGGGMGGLALLQMGASQQQQTGQIGEAYHTEQQARAAQAAEDLLKETRKKMAKGERSRTPYRVPTKVRPIRKLPKRYNGANQLIQR